VLINAGAGRVRRHPGLIERIRALVPAGHSLVTRSVDDVAPALEKLRDAGIESLVVLGGDGSVGGTLTPLLRVWPADHLPRLAWLPGGSVNTFARALSGGGRPERTLARLVAQAQRGEFREEQHAPLEVRADRRPARVGLLFGEGAVERWLRFYYAHAHASPVGAVAALAWSLGSAALRGSLARRMFEPYAARVWIDGRPQPLERYTGMAASALPDIGLGFRPFYLAGVEPQRFHWLDTDTSGARLALELPAARLGRRARGTPIRDASAARVLVHHGEPRSFTVDADLFEPAQAIEIRAGPLLRFWRP
jgi:diacylglycerol kinase (ATP)